MAPTILTSALIEGEWLASRSDSFTPRERAPGTHWIGRWVSPRARLEAVEKRNFLPPPELELRPFARPARSHSLYRVNYSGSLSYCKTEIKIVQINRAGSCGSNLLDLYLRGGLFESWPGHRLYYGFSRFFLSTFT
jgi:hypothetical protein